MDNAFEFFIRFFEKYQNLFNLVIDFNLYLKS